MDYPSDPDEIVYLDDLPLWSAPFGIALLEAVRYLPNIRVLDIGTGTGFPLLELARRLGPESRLYGLDSWDGAFAHITAKAAARGLGNVSLVKGFVEDLPFNAGAFHLVTSNNGLNNAADLTKGLEEITRVLKKGGQFVHTFNLPMTMKGFYELFRVLVEQEHFPGALDALEDHINQRRRSLAEIIELLKSRHYEVHVRHTGDFSWSSVDGGSFLRHHFIRSAFLPGWKAVIPKNSWESFYQMLEAVLDRKAKREGGLRFAIPFACIDGIKAGG